MEEPPKIERLLSSRGITLSDASNILKSYVAIIDHHYGPPHNKPRSSTKDDDDGIDDDTTPSNNNNEGNNNNNPFDKQRSRRQDIAEEREEERLLARLNQLDPTKESSNSNHYRLGSSISEDVFERLRMIMESVSGEAEGRVVSAVGVYASSSMKGGEEQGGDDNDDEGGDDVLKGELDNDGQDEFMKELEEAERLETEQLQQEPKVEEQQNKQKQIDYEQKKKDKKAKKAAKKAKKEAKKKRKASSGGANEEKRIKVEED